VPSTRGPSGCASAATHAPTPRHLPGGGGGEAGGWGELDRCADARRNQAEQHRMTNHEILIAELSVGSSAAAPRSAARTRRAAAAAVGAPSSSSNMPVRTSCPCRATSVWCDRRRTCSRSAGDSASGCGLPTRSLSTCRSGRRTTRAIVTFRRPTRHAAFNRRAGGRGSSLATTDLPRLATPRPALGRTPVPRPMPRTRLP
jgi:hypothetical protein